MIKNNKNNNTILVISSDDTIIDCINLCCNNYKIVPYKDNLNIEEFDLIILDNFNFVDKSEIYNILKFNNIINISDNEYNNITNIKRPFSLYYLIKLIKNKMKNELNILTFKNFKIINNIIYINGKDIKLGSKETLLVNFLYKNGETDKNNLLQNIWKYNNEIETKVLENTVNKIRQKFKLFNIDDFIILNDKKYKINNLYL